MKQPLDIEVGVGRNVEIQAVIARLALPVSTPKDAEEIRAVIHRPPRPAVAAAVAKVIVPALVLRIEVTAQADHLHPSQGAVPFVVAGS